MKRASLVFGAIVLLTNCLPILAEAPVGVDSREIKILLRTEAFEGPEDFFESSLATLRVLAAERKVALREPGGEPKVKTRELRYFDTRDFALRSQGWLLRQRVKVRGDRIADTSELAFKFSSSIRGKTAAASVSAADSYQSDEEFEEDIIPVAENGPWQSRYARRCKVKGLPVFERPSLSELLEIYPSLAEVGLPAETKFETVGGPILERRIQPGYLDFGNGVLADLEITWFEDADGQALAAEFSYDYEIGGSKSSVPSLWASLQFLPALHLALGDTWQPGLGKTALVYEQAGFQKP